ncbi:uncharacterized protein [Littorina saxatilis]|uniref:Uncharacterized protein n=1 Tax=Littorina saxatilis TaxID=31220 RepID=A0AAN9C2A7_9CAEN
MAAPPAENGDFKELKLTISGVTRTFAEWTEDFVDRYYPDLHQRCYRVPALHFNRQELSTKSVTEDGEGVFLKSHILQGDLAHTVILEHFERLGHHLQEHRGTPLFIISSLEFDNYLAKIPNPQNPKKKKRYHKKKQKNETEVADQGKREPTLVTEKAGGGGKGNEGGGGVGGRGGGGGGGIWNEGGGGGRAEGRRDDPRPQQPPRAGQRGEMDVVILSQKWGVILVEVKSTMSPHNTWQHSAEEKRRRVLQAIQQVKESNRVVNEIMPDLSCLPQCVTQVVALPYISREQLQQVLLDEDDVGEDVVFICKDDLDEKDLRTQEAANTQGHETGVDTTETKEYVPTSEAWTPPLYDWWQRTIGEGKQPLPLKDMRTMVGRTCGLLSIVRVWTWTKPRVEVRTAAQAISQVGECFSQVVLTPTQTAILADRASTHVVLSGPMGSGKTLMLQLKGRQWASERKRVIILNVRNSARGRPTGFLLEEAIKRHTEEVQSGTVERYNRALDDFKMETFAADLKQGSTDNLGFLLDELTRNTFRLVTELRERFPNATIWCSNMNCRGVPEGFCLYRLTDCLRCPPSVQLLLKELDLNPLNKGVYTTRSAVRGLPCDGPPCIFIYHKEHNTDVRASDCVQCADRLVDILHNLGLVFPCEISAQDEQTPTAQRRAKKATFVDAAPLTFRDVLFLYSIPPAYWKQVGEHRWETDIPDVIKCILYQLRCKFLLRLSEQGVPMKFALDMTSRDIALPTKGEITVTDVVSVPSLERKVVIFMSGGEAFTDQEVDSTSVNMAVKLLQNTFGKETDAAPSPTSKDEVHSSNAGDNQAGRKEMDTSMEDAAVNMLHSLLAMQQSRIAFPNIIEATKEDIRQTIKKIFRNLKVKTAAQWFEGKHFPDTPSSTDKVGIKARRSMEARGDSPGLLAALKHQEKTIGLNAPACSARNGPRSTSSQSLFSVPDFEPKECHMDGQKSGEEKRCAEEDGQRKESNHTDECGERKSFTNEASLHKNETVADHMSQEIKNEDESIKESCIQQESSQPDEKKKGFDRESERENMDTLLLAERHRIQEAMSSLSMDDQDLVFLAASRCLSQLVVFID